MLEPFKFPDILTYQERRKIVNCDCYKSEILEKELKEALEILRSYPSGQDDGKWITSVQDFLYKHKGT